MRQESVATNDVRREQTYLGSVVAHNTRCEHSDISIEQGICWHRPCEVTLVFRDGYWAVNKQGFGRRFRRNELSQLATNDELWQLATSLAEAAEGLQRAAVDALYRIRMDSNFIGRESTRESRILSDALAHYEEAAK